MKFQSALCRKYRSERKPHWLGTLAFDQFWTKLHSFDARARARVCVCVFQFSLRRSPSGSAVRNHCLTHPAPCVRPRCVCSVLRAHVQVCRFDKADATIFQLRAH